MTSCVPHLDGDGPGYVCWKGCIVLQGGQLAMLYDYYAGKCPICLLSFAWSDIRL